MRVGILLVELVGLPHELVAEAKTWKLGQHRSPL